MQNRIHIITAVMMLAIIATCAITFYNVLSWLIPVTITNPELWLRSIEDRSLVHFTLTLRSALFIAWSIHLSFVLMVSILALRALKLYWDGTYFTIENYRRLITFGLGLIFVMLISTPLVSNVQHYIYATSYENVDPSFAFLIYPEQLALVTCGAFFCVIGYVMKLATEIKEDNESII